MKSPLTGLGMQKEHGQAPQRQETSPGPAMWRGFISKVVSPQVPT